MQMLSLEKELKENAYPGSFEHEFQDAATFSGWDVDYLKYDYCFKPRHMLSLIHILSLSSFEVVIS